MPSSGGASATMQDQSGQNGQFLNFDNILRLIKKQCFGLNKDYVKPMVIALRVMANLDPADTTTPIIYLAAAQVAQEQMLRHPDYSILAARLEIAKLYGETKEKFSEIIDHLYKASSKNIGTTLPVITSNFHNIVMRNASCLDSSIRHIRDSSYKYISFKILEQFYLLKIDNIIVERPQHLLMRVAIGIHGEDIDAAIETYNYMSEGYFTHLTSTLYSVDVSQQQYSLCFPVTMPQVNRSSILRYGEKCALITTYKGDISANISKVRLGEFSVLEIFMNVSQKTNEPDLTHPRSMTAYMEPWHVDILEFLDMNPYVFRGLWIPDLFMKRVEADQTWSLMCPFQSRGLSDCWGEEFEALYKKYELERRYVKQISARKLWSKIIACQQQTGNPVMLYKDTCNSKSNQQHLGTVNNSDIFGGAIHYTSSDETSLCIFASIAVNKFVKSEEKGFNFLGLKAVTKVVTRNLNKLVDVKCYSHQRADANISTAKHRPIGIGIQGLADTLILLRIPFDSKEAALLNQQIFETLYYGALEASCELSEVHGPYSTYPGSPISKGILQYDMWNKTPSYMWDWTTLKAKIAQHGVRNSLLITCMPTETTARILGNNESILPFPKNIYPYTIKDKTYFEINSHLIKTLIEAGLWNNSVRDQLVNRDGSVQHIAEIPDEIKTIYKTLTEIHPNVLLDMAADRGAFVDQSQFVLLHMANSNWDSITKVHFYGWRKGLKTGLSFMDA